MSIARRAKVAMALLASVLLTTVVVVSSASHDEQDEPGGPGAGGSGPAASQPVDLPANLVGLEISLGLRDTRPSEWEGDITVSEGRVLEVDVVRSAPTPKVTGSRFSVGTTKKKAAAKKKKVQAKKKQAAILPPVLRVNLDAPANATVTVNTGQGQFSFGLGDLPLGTRKTFLDGQASVERQNAAVALTGMGTEDDFPTLAKGPDGSAWLAYVEYRPERPRIAPNVKPDEFDRLLVPERHGDRIRLRRFDGKTWQPALEVTGAGLDVWRPAVAVDGQGNVWVAWAQQRDGDWEIYRRTYTPPSKGQTEGRWSDVVRVSHSKGSDFHVVAATDVQGTVWLAWQSWREGQYDIVASAQREGHAWSTPRPISESPANDWGPSIAADSQGNVYVAWDTYDRGNYDVRLRALSENSKPIDVASSARFEGRPHLACDARGRVWIAYEEGDEQWGKDYANAGQVSRVGLAKNPGFALYVNRTVRMKCLADGTLMRPAGSLDDALRASAIQRSSVPRLVVDSGNGVWLLLRHHPLPGGQGEAWVSSCLRYDGESWSKPRRLSASSNLIDNRPALVSSGPGLVAVYSSDHRANTQNRGEDDLYATILSESTPAKELALVADAPSPEAALATVHPEETADIARMRAYRIEVGGKSLRLLRGEFHRHTEFSSHNDQDGLLEDTWRYALDAARHDWMGNGDHDNGFGHEYMWWLIQKSADLHFHPPRFVAAQTYERSVVYPNGHRNVMMPKRGIRPLPRGDLQGTPEEGTPDTKRLYEYLKHFGGICASHTSATDMGTDWRDNDPNVEPVVEIYQGHRHNYEHPGAPRSPTAETQIGGFQPAGFIWNALGKGYRLGFESSSDHVSTHMSYAVVLAEEVSRQEIIDAFKARHCYAATDNIVLDVRSGGHLMGDAFDTRENPVIEIRAQGTKPIAKLHVVRDNTYALTTEPNKTEVTFRYTDDNAKPGETHYYYVRLEQSDGNLAWASPMWISRKD